VPTDTLALPLLISKDYGQVGAEINYAKKIVGGDNETVPV